MNLGKRQRTNMKRAVMVHEMPVTKEMIEKLYYQEVHNMLGAVDSVKDATTIMRWWNSTHPDSIYDFNYVSV